MDNAMDSQFIEPIACYNIKTGEGFCRIQEIWEQESVKTYPSMEAYYEATARESEPEQPVEKTEEAPRRGNWTPKEKLLVEEMLEQGDGLKEIAKKLNRTVGSVRGVVAHLKKAG